MRSDFFFLMRKDFFLTTNLTGAVHISKKVRPSNISYRTKFLLGLAMALLCACMCVCACLKKNQNAPRPSEHPPVRGKMPKRLGGIIGCKYKISMVFERVPL